MAQLLVSVRSRPEAVAALAGGADIIDVKEPANGPLGRPAAHAVRAIVELAAGRCPITVALGELAEDAAVCLDQPVLLPPGVWLAKIGLAGCALRGDWRARAVQLGHLHRPLPLVLAAYADWQRANAPSPIAALDAAIELGAPAFLLDTWRKDGRGLLHWLADSELAKLRQLCTRAGSKLALAGSLGLTDLPRVIAVEPDIIAVRGAACRDGIRGATIDPDRVRQLAERVHAESRRFTSVTGGSRSTIDGNHGSR